MGGVPGRATVKHSGSDASDRSGSGRQERDKTGRDDWPKECKAKRLSGEPVRHSAHISKKKTNKQSLCLSLFIQSQLKQNFGISAAVQSSLPAGPSETGVVWTQMQHATV